MPKTSALTWTLNRLCDGADDVDHPHQVMTGKKLSEEAGTWPWSLAREVLHGALVDKCHASIETIRKVGKRYRERFPGAISVFSTVDKHVICKELQLRAPLTTVYACHGKEVPAVLPDTVRRIYIVIGEDQKLAEMRDVWISDLEIEIGYSHLDITDEDALLLVSVQGGKWPEDDAFCYLAIRATGTSARAAPYPGAPWRAPTISQPAFSQAEARAPAPDVPNALPAPDNSRPEQVRGETGLSRVGMLGPRRLPCRARLGCCRHCRHRGRQRCPSGRRCGRRQRSPA